MLMNGITRLIEEYSALRRVLAPGDFFAMLLATASHAPEILRTKRLASIDVAMSRNMTIRLGDRRLALPLGDIDRLLAPHNDNPTFGNVREMYARNCYLQRLNVKGPLRTVLDLGANRGMFSVFALVALGADRAIGIEPNPVYEPVARLLLQANQRDPGEAPRYVKFVSSPSAERENPASNISIQTILREQKVERFGFVKMDIEGHEKQLFGEPGWLESVDTLAMELHPHFAGDLSLIPAALERYGFRYIATAQSGEPAEINKAMFLYASCTGALAV
jgi:hypothetical protein